MALLENERVCLRALEPEDLELLYRWENDSELWEVGNTLAHGRGACYGRLCWAR